MWQPRNQSRVRLCVEELECRAVPAVLTPIGVPGSAALLGDHAQVSGIKSAKADAHDRPFHAKDSGTVEIIGAFPFPPGTIINASASGQAAHLGAFTLHDTSKVVAAEDAIRYIEGSGYMEAANGDRLYFSFTGSLDLSTFTATVKFEWTGADDGRFANATGATVWHVTVNPGDFTYTAVANGVINY